MSDPFVIMFVCTGNTCRSPMAEAALKVLLEKERPEAFHVMSSGTSAASGFPATTFAVEAALIWDADLSEHESQPLTEELVERADLILGMTQRHVEEVVRLNSGSPGKVFLFKNFPDTSLQGDGVDDPIGAPLDRYNETFLEVGEYLGKYLSDIVALIDARSNVG